MRKNIIVTIGLSSIAIVSLGSLVVMSGGMHRDYTPSTQAQSADHFTRILFAGQRDGGEASDAVDPAFGQANEVEAGIVLEPVLPG